MLLRRTRLSCVLPSSRHTGLAQSILCGRSLGPAADSWPAADFLARGTTACIATIRTDAPWTWWGLPMDATRFQSHSTRNVLGGIAGLLLLAVAIYFFADRDNSTEPAAQSGQEQAD